MRRLKIIVFVCLIFFFVMLLISGSFQRINEQISLWWMIQKNLAQESPYTNLDLKYFQGKLKSPAESLRLSLMAFPYDGLRNIGGNSDPANSIKILSQFPYIVCAEPGHLAKEEIEIAQAIKDSVKLFGYVNMGGTPLPDLNLIKEEIDRIAENNWYGVFIDQFGYDFGETRERQNKIVTYSHSKGLKCFVNAWHIDDALGNSIVAQHNPTGEVTKLKNGDWYLNESFLMNNSGYSGDIQASLEKYLKAQEYKERLGIRIACLSYKRQAASWEKSTEDIKTSYLLSLCLGFDAWWFSDRLEDPEFLFGADPDLDVGNVLQNKLITINPEKYLAETDKYILAFRIKQDTPISLVVYDKSQKKSYFYLSLLRRKLFQLLPSL